MDFLKKMLTQTGAHFRGLTGSQRIAIVLCVLVITVSLLWLVQWSGRRAYEPLATGVLAEEELAAVRAKLEEWRIDYKMEGERIMVPPNTRHDVTARLLDSETLPAGAALGFEQLLADESPWLSEAEKERRWTLALSNELAATLSRTAGVKKARVFIDNRQKRMFGGASVRPSAVVSIWPKPDFVFDRKRVHMFASFVSGAVAGLEIDRVRVIDESAGRSYTARDPEADMAGDLLALRRSEEEYYIRKILDRLSYIPGVLVQVFAEQETERRQVESTVLDKPAPSRSKTETTTETRQSQPTGPGVRPNTSVAVGAAGTAETRETEVSEEEFEAERGRQVTSRQNTKGVIKRMTASIGVPRSWLIGTYKKVKGKDQEPTDQELARFETDEFAKIVEGVSKIIDARQADQVAVSSFPDDAVVAAATPAERATFVALAERYGGGAGLAALAVLSLAMMMRVVRKAPEGPRVPGGFPGAETVADEASAAKQRGAWTQTAQPLGEDGSSESLLEGRELGEETARTQQMVGQVADLARKDPESVAALVSRWMSQAER